MMQNQSRVWLILAVTFALAISACGPDETNGFNNNNGISTGNNRGNNDDLDAGDSGTGDAEDLDDAGDTDGRTDTEGDAGDGGTDTDETCPETPCAADKICFEGDCLDATPANKCRAAQDLGELAPDGTITISDTTFGASDVLSNSCGAGGDELVYKFSVTGDSNISFVSSWPQQFDAKVEFRLGDCEDPGDALACFDADDSLFVPGGTDVWLVVEQDVGRGNDFGLELAASAETCPSGERFCDSSALEVCLGDGESSSFACAADCTSATACAGISCSQPVAVSASTNFSGSLGAYDSALDFETNASCEADGDAVSTPGAEVYFKLEGLSAGQTVSIGTGGNRAIFITTDCAQPITCEDVLLSSGTSGTVEWTVPATAGGEDYYVIIDKRTQTAGDFEYTFDITDP